jgi:ribosome-associated protein
MLEVNERIAIPLKELNFTFSRSSGPGGQNVNKVNSKVTLHWPVRHSPSLPDDVRERFLQKFATRITGDGEVVVVSQRYRDQGRNVADCMEKLAAMIREASIVPRKRKKTKPTRGSKERRLKEKRAASARKQLRRTPAKE